MADLDPDTPAADPTPATPTPTRSTTNRPSNRRTTAAAARADAAPLRSDPPLTSKTRQVSGTTFPATESLGARMAADQGHRYFLRFNGIDWWVMERTDDGDRRAFNAGRDAARAAEALAAYNED